MTTEGRRFAFGVVAILVVLGGIVAIASVAEQSFNRPPCKDGYVWISDRSARGYCVLGYRP